MIVAMTPAEPLVAALRVCPTGPQAEKIVPMPVLMSHLSHMMWDPVVMSWTSRLAYPTLVHPAAGMADRVVLAPTDLVPLVTQAGFPTRVAAAGSWSLAYPMPVAVAVNPAYPMPAAVAATNRSPVFPNRLLAAVNPAYPMLAAVAAGSWSLACPRLVAVAQAAVSPVFPNLLPAAAHSDPRRQAAAGLAYPIHQLVAQAAPRDYRSPVPVDSSYLAQLVAPGVANQ